MSGKDPFEGMPDGMWEAEWVAMHTNFRFPEVTDAGFLVAFKKVMIEVAGNRLYDYRAAEQVDELLDSMGLSCPDMEREAAADGYARRAKIKDFIRLQIDQVYAQIPQPRCTVDYSDILERSLTEKRDAYERRQ